jgi:transposase
MMTQTNQFIQRKTPDRYLTEFQLKLLKQQSESESVAEYRQRIEIMLLADEGKTQSQICRELNCSPLTARHWIFMAKSGQAHNWQTQPIGRPKIVTSDYLERLKQLISASPRDLGYPFSRWTGQWLEKHLSREFNIVVSARHINRLIEKIEAEVRSIASEADQQQPPAASHHLVIADLFVTE